MTTDTRIEDRLAAARRRDRLCDQFERGGSTRPAIEQVIHEVPETERTELLQELIALEVHYRRKEGESFSAIDYLTRFPSLDPTWLHRLLPPDGDTLPAHRAEAVALPTRTIADYELLEELGRGGMGVVYRARQMSLKRLVALKVLRDATADADEQSRLRAEAEAAARLQHPNIVQVFEVGERDGQPFLAMELCEGGNLAARLNGTPLPAVDAALLLKTLAEAVQHAHERGVVHRDLKPANVLFGGSSDQCKVADFGLARRLDAETLRTQSGDVLGTPSYMAPEQALGRSRQAGPAADVYALGAILYECLTGRPPFKAATTLETLQQVVSVEPVAPRQLQPGTPRDLNTVCLHCLHKEPSRRYPTAQGLADDLGRFLRGEPTRARPVGPLGRTVKWARRNPLPTALGVTLLVGVTVASGLAWRAAVSAHNAAINAQTADEQRGIAETNFETAEAERQKADRARDRAERMLYFRNVNAAHRAWRESELALANGLLDECRSDLRDWEYRYLRRLNFPSKADLQLPVPSGTPWRTAVAFASDGSWVAASGSNTIQFWDAATRRPIRSLQLPRTVALHCLAVRPDDKWIAAGGGGPALVIWDATTGEQLFGLSGSRFPVDTVAFSPDGRSLVSGGGSGQAGELIIWDLESRKIRARVKDPQLRPVRAVAFRPDGTQIASAGSDYLVRYWSADDAREFRPVGAGSFLAGVQCLAWHRDNNRLVGGVSNGAVYAWHLGPSGPLSLFKGSSAAVQAVALNKTGTQLAAAGRDRTVLVWDFPSGDTPSVFRGHNRPVSGLAFAPDGRLASVDDEGVLKLWEPASSQECLPLLPPGNRGVSALAFAGGADRLVANSGDALLVWDVRTGRLLGELARSPQLRVMRADATGRLLVAVDAEKTVRLWDLDVASATAGGMLIRSRTIPNGPVGVVSIALSRDGRRLVCGDQAGVVSVWGPQRGERVATCQVGPGDVLLHSQLALDDAGRTLVTVTRGEVRVWDPETGQLRGSRKVSGCRMIALSPDGERLAGSGEDVSVHLWDTHSDAPPLSIRAHGQYGVTGLEFSHDGRRLLTTGHDGAVRLWDAASGQEALTLLASHKFSVMHRSVDPNGRRIACATGREIYVWDAPTEP